MMLIPLLLLCGTLGFSSDASHQPIKSESPSDNDPDESWNFFLFKTLFNQHLEQDMTDLYASCACDKTSFAGYTMISDELFKKALPLLQSEIEILKSKGFSEKEAIKFLNTDLQEQHWDFETHADDIYVSFIDNFISDDKPSFIMANAQTYSIDAFYQLPLAEREQKLIHELIKTMAEKNIWGLLFKKRELEKLGKKINQVHPMRFIGYILSDPKLKKYMREIKSSSFKWEHFINGFANRMKEENSRNNLNLYIPGMAHLLKINQERIVNYINSKDYEGLVVSLL